MEFPGDKAMSSSTQHGNFKVLVGKIKWHVSSDWKVDSRKHSNSEFACMTLFGLFSESQMPLSGGNGQSSSHSNRFPWSSKASCQSLSQSGFKVNVLILVGRLLGIGFAADEVATRFSFAHNLEGGC
jgi:hypothetical protein